ncbi:copper resistance D family protein [Blastococcus capsensis]|uniref:copper resistance D family protein n=1 Tax=Blastococcus capsensis TaxID=1564163 RepID=UPI00253F89BD|nr:CopD family protein [Blastococcus capsensis]MDK3258748.1 CopD family protein [Blastococcus capsensis]
MSSAAPATRRSSPEPAAAAVSPAGPVTSRGTGVALTGVALTALLLGSIELGATGAGPDSSGLAGAGPLVEWSLPVVTLAGRIAAVGTIGTLLFAAVLLPGGRAILSPAGRRAAAAASWWAVGWAGATALGAVLTLSRLVGVPPTALTWSSVRVFVDETGAGRAALLVAVLAAVLALGARRCTRPGTARVLLAGALGALVTPVALSGHASGAGDHVLAATALAVHVVAAGVWVGGLLALVTHGRSSGVLAPAVARFSPIALLCLLVTAVSGVVAAGAVLGGAAALLGALGSGYGWLLTAKTSALVVLGVLGWQHRRRTLPRLHAGEPGSFRRFAAVEVLLMLATLALAVALAASPPPQPATAAAAGPGSPGAAAPGTAADPMAGHDHGELSVAVLIDGERFHVAGPVAAGARVTVHNGTEREVTITAADGSFDVVVAGRSLITFLAPTEPGRYPFTSRHSAAFGDVLVVE